MSLLRRNSKTTISHEIFPTSLNFSNLQLNRLRLSVSSIVTVSFRVLFDCDKSLPPNAFQSCLIFKYFMQYQSWATVLLITPLLTSLISNVSFFHNYSLPNNPFLFYVFIAIHFVTSIKKKKKNWSSWMFHLDSRFPRIA